jgi:GT2 family glycosyltransferase
MPRLGSAIQIPILLVRAIGRNSLRNVLIFALLLLRKRGLFGAIRYAALTSDQRRQEANKERRLASLAEDWDEDREADLDNRYRMPLTRWKDLARQKTDHTAALANFSQAQVIDVGVVIQGAQTATPEALAKTCRALAELAENSAIGAMKIYTEDILLFEPPDSAIQKVSTVADLPHGERDWIFFLEAGDSIAPTLCAHLAEANANTLVLTFDMMMLEDEIVSPLFCPGANPTLARTVDYTFSRLAVRPALIGDGPLHSEDGGYAILRQWLGATATRDAESRWKHVFDVSAEIRLTQAELESRLEGLRARAVTAAETGHVSAIICTKDKGYLIHQLVRSLRSLSAGLIQEIIIVANNMTNPIAVQSLEAMRDFANVSILKYDGAFNFSKMSNLGAQQAQGEYLLFLNDDIVPITDHWLGILLAAFVADEELGVAGPLLLYPNERVQHAGMYLGYRGAAGHTLRFARLPDEEYLYYASAKRQVSAVTGAVMLVSRVCFSALNGFDENLPTFLQDVDLCRRAHEAGFAVIFEPGAVLLHMESATMRPLVSKGIFAKQREREAAYYQRRWSSLRQADPYHNPAFAADDETLRTLA